MDKPAWLTPEIHAILGVVPDKVVATRTGTTQRTVNDWRRRLGIPSHRSRRAAMLRTYGASAPPEDVQLHLPAWLTPGIRALMGTAPDAEVAKGAQVGESSIQKWRKRLGVERAPLRPRPTTLKSPQWLTEQVAGWMGTMPDSAIADRVGLKAHTIGKWRRRLGIARARPVSPSWLTSEIQAKLGTVSDGVIAELVGASPASVAEWRKRLGIESYRRLDVSPSWLTPEIRALMGTISDQNLAKRAGVERYVLQRWRVRLGIPSNRSRQQALRSASAHSAHQVLLPPWLTPAIRELLGVVPDSLTASQTGVRPNTIAKWRALLGIQMRPKRKPAALDWASIDRALTEQGEASPYLPAWLTQEIRGLFGTMPDRWVGRRASVRGDTVSVWRKRLGVPAHQRTKGSSTASKKQTPRKVVGTPPEWLTDQIRGLMGAIPDSAVARQAHVGRSTVTDWRRRLGISPCPPPREVDWNEVDRALVEGVVSPRLPVWITPEIRAAMGVVSDQKIANQIGISVPIIRNWRKRLGVPSTRASSMGWLTPEIRRLMGTTPDAEIAALAGVSVATVARWRNRCGIRFDRTPVWLTTETIAIMGTMSDAQLAQRVGALQNHVGCWRRRLGITSYQDRKREARRRARKYSDAGIRDTKTEIGQIKGIDWDAQPDLGRVSDLELAHRLGVAPVSVRTARKSRGIAQRGQAKPRGPIVPWDDVAELGFRSDNEIAREYNVAPKSVAGARRRRQIPPFSRTPTKDIDWDEQPLGQQSDASLADELGVRSGTVRKARMARAIAPYSPTKWNVDWNRVLELGERSDADIARELDVPPRLVRDARIERGIPAYSTRIDWSGVEELGQTTDIELARRLEVPVHVVGYNRRRLGIPAYDRRRDEDRGDLSGSEG